MANQHLYIAAQKLANLSQANFDILIAAMQAKGQANGGSNPNLINHWRASLDGTIVIFEALFESTNIDVDWFINWMAGIFAVDPADVGDVTGFNSYGRFSTFSYPSGVTNRLRVGVFGFVSGQGWPTYAESHAAVLQYLADNITEWEIDTV